MLEDECHRNFAFTMYHADQMPVLEFGRVETEAVAGAANLWRVRAEVRNTRLIPTCSELRRRERIGWPDLMECQPTDPAAASIVAANRRSDWLDRTPEAMLREPGRLLVESGIPGRQTRVFEFVVQAAPGTGVKLRYTSAWAKPIERDVELPPRAAP